MLELLPVTSVADIKALTALQLNAFLRIPVNSVIWPNGVTPSIQSGAETRYTKSLETDPCARLWKVVDTADGQIIAMAIWYLFLTPEEEGKRRSWTTRMGK